MSFSEDLKHSNIDRWNKILSHKFIIEITENILPISKFIFYLKQDKIFLGSFCNLLTAASSTAYDKETKAWFQSLFENTTRYELPMQDEILHQLEGDVKFTGASAEEIARDYISYMKRVSISKNLAIIVSAMAPCPWTYYEISKALNKNDINNGAFKLWIRFYSSKESREQVNQIKELLNKLAQNADEKKKIEMKNHFSISCNYEIEFWDMAYSYGIQRGLH